MTPPAAPPAPATPPPSSLLPAGTLPGTTPEGGPPPPRSLAQRQDDDPDLAMAKLVSQAREKRGQPTTKPTPEPPKPDHEPAKPAPVDPKPAAEPPADGQPAAPPSLMDLLGKGKPYTKKPPETTPKPTPGVPPGNVQAPGAVAEPPAPVVGPKKTTVVKKKPAVEPPDTAAIAGAAATAATEAVLKRMAKPEPEAPTVQDGLKDTDKQDYEIAAHLATINPRYKGAEKVLLAQIQRTEEYADRWEAANPGKAFDKEAEEHNDFYSSLEQPWTDEEFQDAKVDLIAERKVAKRMAEQEGRFSKLAEDSARVELATHVETKVVQAAGQLAKLVGDEIHALVAKGGYDALEAEDPVMAQVLGATLTKVTPFIEAVVQIDDPRGRIQLDMNNPVHQQWNHVVMTGEKECMGKVNEQGQMFATRAAFRKMSEAQQQHHWYLTQDMIIEGVLGYAAAEAKRLADLNKKQLESYGYTRAAARNGKHTPAAGGTKPAHSQNGDSATEAPPANSKPLSPSAGGGAKIDENGTPQLTTNGRMLEQMITIRNGR